MHLIQRGRFKLLFTDSSLDLNWRSLPPDLCRRNWNRVKSILDVDPLRIAYLTQIHSSIVREVKSWGYQGPGDGLLTFKDGVALVVLVADCLPILMFDSTSGFCGALHCGWRPLSKGIIEEALKKAKSRGVKPENLEVFLGPCAGPCCYQVGLEFRKIFPPDVLTEHEGSLRLDIKRFARISLESAGVKSIYELNVCTICHTEYFSYRRNLTRSRQAGIILKC